jgi:hypothetical protein
MSDPNQGGALSLNGLLMTYPPIEIEPTPPDPLSDELRREFERIERTPVSALTERDWKIIREFEVLAAQRRHHAELYAQLTKANDSLGKIFRWAFAITVACALALWAWR